MLQNFAILISVRAKDESNIFHSLGDCVMSIQEKSRAIMARQYQQIKNRQQSMLMRAAQEIGVPAEEAAHYWNPIQGKIDPTTRAIYGRSNAAMS